MSGPTPGRSAGGMRRSLRRTALGIVAVVALVAVAPSATAATDGSSVELPTDFTTAVRTAYARAVHDVGVAYFTTHRRTEPSLNGLVIDQVPSAPPAGGHPLVSRLVAHASRRDLAPADALESHLASKLINSSPCSIAWPHRHRGQAAGSVVEHRCVLIPSLDPAPLGALELVAASRTASSPISPFDLLTAAFETARWRPAGIHPMTAEAARLAAAQMRRRTSGLDRPCHVTALWIAAAIVADTPDIRLVGGGYWVDTDLVLHHLGALARHAARRGCQAADAALGHTAADELAFWDPSHVLAISARADDGIARTLDDMTAGARRAGHPPADLLDSDSSGIPAPFRGCDAVQRVASAGDIVSVSGFRVHECLADSLRQMLRAAHSDGIVLGGWGWRATAAQIELRRANCPLPPRDSPDHWRQLSLLSSFQCSPPTARPTTSQHEFGLAVDFTCDGNSISYTSRCFRWLAANAHRYGLYNLLTEPWHWSTTGR